MTQWARFVQPDGEHFGTVDGNTVRPFLGDMFGECQASGAAIALADVRLVAPVRPSKLIGLWNNFHALAAKLGQSVPREPLCFIKAANSYLDPDSSFRRPPSYEGRIAFEGELGVVIGRRCTGADETKAMDAIFGYTCVNDLTALDLMARDASFTQWMRAKSFDGFGPLGPVVATGLDWSRLHVRTLVDGRERQNFPTSDMVLSPPRIVSMLSGEMTLMPGDVIACGTSLGVSTLRPGQTVEVVIDGIGALKNTFATGERAQ